MIHYYVLQDCDLAWTHILDVGAAGLCLITKDVSHATLLPKPLQHGAAKIYTQLVVLFLLEHCQLESPAAGMQATFTGTCVEQ